MIGDKQAAQDWERFRDSIRKSTPVNLNETPEEKHKRIERLEKDPQAWKEYYFPKYFKYKSPAFHLNASKRLHKNFIKHKHYYEVRHWARGLAKSTNAMFDVLYFAMTGKLKFPVLTSSTYDAAESFLTKYQCQLDSNARLINDYGRQELPGSWAMGDFTTRKGVRFLALGARQSPRGKSNDEIRPDCIIVDDFDTDEECRNEEIIKQKWEWFEKALLFTVDVSEAYLVLWLGNIIAEDCCVVRAGKIADHCETINIRDENGCSVWPEKNTESDIDYLLSKVSYEAGQQEYYNNPIRLGQVFKDLKYGKCPPLKSLRFAVIYGDPSTSNKDKPSVRSRAHNSCKAVGIVGTVDCVKFYVYKAFVDIVNNSTFIDWLYFCNQYVGSSTQPYSYVENNGLQNPFYEQVLKPLILLKGKDNGGVLPIIPDDRNKPEKYFRIEGTLEPLNRLGCLILNEEEKDDPHMKRLEAQFKSVSPHSKTMDGPDMVEGAVVKIKEKFVLTSTDAMKLGRRPPNTKRF